MILFSAGMYFFWMSGNQVVTYVSHTLGIDRWLHNKSSGWLSFFFIMGEFMVRLVLVLFYFSLFKYLFLIIGSPLFAYLSEKTESIMEGKELELSSRQLFRDMWRSIRLALRNSLWQTVYVVSLLLLTLFPVAGWVAPVIAVLVECYYYGFSMLDYSFERHQLSPAAGISFIGQHKGLAIGNGIVFYLMHLVPILGWVLAPAYAVVAATIALYHQNHEEI